MALGDDKLEEPLGRLSASVGKRIPLKERTQSPGKYLLSPNDDGFERRQARLARAAATMRRRSLAFAESVEEPETASSAQKPGVLNSAQVQELLNNCIKLAAENKINQQNTWDLQLIDYLPAIIKADNEGDHQTNFQKASCTLEASAKIYSCRVDSVHSETFKVLGGLNRSAAPAKDARADSAENDAGHEGEQEPRKKDHHKKESDNLESYESLNVKNFEVSLNVDPLFHQTSAQFDEGGAKGLLLNTLSVYRPCEILFDSCDVPEKCMKQDLPTEPSTIDLSFLSETIKDMMDSKESEISPSLQDIVNLLDDPVRKAAEAEETSFQAEEASSWFNDAVDDDDDPGEVFDQPSAAGSPNFGDADPTSWVPNSPEEDGDEFRSYSDANGGQEDSPDGPGAVEDPVDWLKEGMGIPTKNSWAGPNHWKFMTPRVSNAEEPNVKETKRKKKEPFSLVYTSIPEFDSTLLARPRDKRADLLPQTRRSAKTTLPEDLQYQAEDLLKLFLRPSVMWIRGRGRKAGSVNFREAATPGAMWNGDADDSFDNDVGWHDDGDNRSDVDNNVDELVAQPRKVQKIEIDYDKTSKQVDVRALKQSLWEHLQEASDETVHEEGEPPEEVHFSKVFSRVPESCSAAAPEDISVHLCFICLLHLANEHNLEILGVPTMDELIIRNVQQ